MPFSLDARYEVARLLPARKCCRKTLLLTLLSLEGKVAHGGASPQILVETSHAPLARLLGRLGKKVLASPPVVAFRKVENQATRTRYLLLFSLPGKEMNSGCLNRSSTCCRRLALRGAFLASGSLSHPGRAYHLEFPCRTQEQATEIVRLLKGFFLSPRSFLRKGERVVYLKDSDSIAEFLRIIGATQTLLAFEEVRIIKETKNIIHRRVNCETGNLEKVARAASRHLHWIGMLQQTHRLSRLPRPLRSLAKLRLKHPDLSLRELGERHVPPLHKSTVSHRLQAIEEIAGRSRS